MIFFTSYCIYFFFLNIKIKFETIPQYYICMKKFKKLEKMTVFFKKNARTTTRTKEEKSRITEVIFHIFYENEEYYL